MLREDSNKKIKRCTRDSHVFKDDNLKEGSKCQCGSHKLINKNGELRPIYTTLYDIKNNTHFGGEND